LFPPVPYIAHHEPSARAGAVNADNVGSMIDVATIARMNAVFERDVTASPTKSTAAVQRAAKVVADPSVVLAFVANLLFEVNMVVSPVMR
jgi:hypothetical protein